jgi:hypothetical protein
VLAPIRVRASLGDGVASLSAELVVLVSCSGIVSFHPHPPVCVSVFFFQDSHLHGFVDRATRTLQAVSPPKIYLGVSVEAEFSQIKLGNASTRAIAGAIQGIFAQTSRLSRLKVLATSKLPPPPALQQAVKECQ